MSFAIILDFIVVGFLIATICYAISLNKKLTRIYQSREDLQKFIENFTTSLHKAETSMEKLRGSGERTFLTLHEKLLESNRVRDDLTFLMERAEDVAQKLEDAVRTGRFLHKAVLERENPSPVGSAQPGKEEADDASQPELMRALRNVR